MVHSGSMIRGDFVSLRTLLLKILHAQDLLIKPFKALYRVRSNATDQLFSILGEKLKPWKRECRGKLWRRHDPVRPVTRNTFQTTTRTTLLFNTLLGKTAELYKSQSAVRYLLRLSGRFVERRSVVSVLSCLEQRLVPLASPWIP